MRRLFTGRTKYKLRHSFMSFDLSHYVGFPHAAIRKIREQLLVQELERREI